MEPTDTGADTGALLDAGADAPIDGRTELDAAPDARDAGALDAASSGTIGPDGGTVSAGDAEVTIPAGALAADVAIAVGTVTAPVPLPAEWEAVSPTWAFTPHGTTFAVPVSIRIVHTGMADAVLRLDDPSDPAWDTVTGVSLGATEATFGTSGFSFYVVVRRVSTPGVVEPLHPSAPGWNDYVLNDGPDVLSSSGAVCTAALATAGGLHTTCIHAGEMRAFDVPGRSTCAGLSATDALGAFEWRCREDAGRVRVISLRLRDETRLADLIDMDALAWRENTVTVSDGGTTVLTTPAARWWGNPIVRDDDGGDLDVPGTVYVVRTDSTARYTIAADRVAMVIEPGHVLRPPTTDLGYRQVGTSGGAVAGPFGTWLEGDLASGVVPPLRLFLVQGVVRHVSVTSTSGAPAIAAEGAVGSRFEHLRFVCGAAGGGTGSGGLAIVPYVGPTRLASGNLVRDVAGARCGDVLRLDSMLSVVEGVLATSSVDGLWVPNSGGSIVADVTSVHNQDDGIRFEANGVLMHATLAHNNAIGLALGASTVAVGVASYENLLSGIDLTACFSADCVPSRLHDVSSWANMLNSVAFVSTRPAGGYGIVFSGRFGTGQTHASPPTRWWSTESACNGIRRLPYPPGDCAGSRATTATPGADGLRSLAVAPYTCELDTNSTAVWNFLGGSGGFFPTRVPPVDEPTNTSDTNGVASYAEVADWFDFAGPYRAWGAEGSATPSCYALGPCSPTSMGTRGCQIYDYALRATSDEFLLGASIPLPTGDRVLSADFFIGPYGLVPSEAACLAAFSGAVIVPADGTRTLPLCRVTFLEHAREVLVDGIGNDNLLCESNETCLFTPNIASYQGHGPLVPSPGTFVDGAIRGVTLVQHETNGVASPFRP